MGNHHLNAMSRAGGDAIEVDGKHLTVADVTAVAASPDVEVHLSAEAAKGIRSSHELKTGLINTGQPIYGVTTGFGASADRQISSEKTSALQHNLIRFQLNGTGPEATDEVVRATMLIRANCLARGNSAVTPEIIQRLLDLLNHDVLPVVFERGSVGASGDLVPLSYVASALVGEGTVHHRGVERPAEDVLAELDLGPVDLGAKDGLALVNGTSFPVRSPRSPSPPPRTSPRWPSWPRRSPARR